MLVDLHIASDILDQRVFLERVKYLDFPTFVIKWFDSYLSKIKLLVCIDNVFSEAGALKYGLPQGSILGPFLFLLYVNDLPNYYQKLTPICMQMKLAFSTNKTFLKNDNFSIQSFRHYDSGSYAKSCHFILEKIKLSSFCFQRQKF